MEQVRLCLFRGGLYLAWASLLTWPLVVSPYRSFPLGLDQVCRSVQQLNMWTIWWNADRLLHGWAGYWDAPIFYPEHSVFALSEPQPMTVLLAPLVWLFPVSAVPYNVYFLISLILNGLLAEALMRRMQVGRTAALVTGLLVTALPFVHFQRDVIQLVPIWGILWFWGALASLAESPKPRRGVELGLAFSSVVLSCLHHALFLVMLSLASAWWLVVDRLRVFRFWKSLGWAGLVAVMICGPFVWPQARILQDARWHREHELVESLSAWPSDYLHVWKATWHGPPPLVSPRETGPWNLSPGWMVMLLGVMGLLATLWELIRNRTIPFAEILDETPSLPKVAIDPAAKQVESHGDVPAGLDSQASLSGVTAPRSRGAWVGFLATVCLCALVLSCGTHIRWGDSDLHSLLNQFVPGYRQLRNVFRFALFLQIAAACLAGLGIDALLQGGCFAHQRLLRWQRPLKWVVCCRRAGIVGIWLAVWTVILLALLEMRPYPVPLGSIPRTHAIPPAIEPAWVVWVREQTDPSEVIAHLPFPVGGTALHYMPTTDWMFWQMRHGRRMVNGYSGFFPNHFRTLRDSAVRFPARSSIEALADSGVNWCLVNRSAYPELAGSLAQPGFELVFVDDLARMEIYRVDLARHSAESEAE